MTVVTDLFPLRELTAEVAEGYVKATAHPTLPLTIFAYTRAAQYDARWNRVTTQCRGLVVENETHKIVARPFPKFWNVGEHGTRDYAPPLPAEPFRVYEKLDGSLGIVFYYDEAWRVASRGSFISDQAQWAQRVIDGTAAKYLDVLDRDVTYCCEVIYPANRIVVDYGSREDLALLAAFRLDGTEVPLHTVVSSWHLGSVIKSYAGIASLDDLLAHTEANLSLNDSQVTVDGTDEEGFVIRFASGIRAKAKYVEYVRLHRLLTGVTERDIWRAVGYEWLATGPDLSIPAVARALKCSEDEVAALATAPRGPVATLVEGVPDEFDQWVAGIRRRLDENALAIMMDAAALCHEVIADCADKGVFARKLQAATSDKTILSCCYSIWDQKPIRPIVWRALYPAASTPFREDDVS